MLPTGARLGPYEIVGPIGAGGMGEVYRARDTRLGREVAVKVLPADLSGHPGRLKRFEREARSASALNHPNIVTIYDIGSADSISYIAMELVTGKTLRSVLLDGALPIQRLLQVAVQAAEGLARAHEAGIVHRDLKPENVMVTEDGLVKILDFGLAKLGGRLSDSEEGSHLATETGTTPGLVVGTMGYMSPEQTIGESIDFRSDQFSFGSVLYEMATGRRAFQRESAPETMTAILREEPEPIEALNHRVPSAVRWIAERCLAKEPRQRYSSTDDLAKELATVRNHLSEAMSAARLAREPQAPARKRRWWIPVVGAAATLLALGIAGWRLRQRDYFWKNPLAGARYTRFTDWEGSELEAEISPDGKFVAFISDRAGPFDIWVTQVGSGEFLNLSKGQQGGFANRAIRDVGFSDDGAHVWFPGIRKGEKGGDVWIVPTMGGAPRPFLRDGVEAAWSPDRTRLVYHTYQDGDPMFIADGNGGNPRRIFVGRPGIHNHYPTWSPDGRFVYFVTGIPPNEMDVWRIPAAGGVAVRLTRHNSRVAYPVLLDDRTLIYTATREDSAGSGLYAMDVDRRIPHEVSSGLEEYLSIAASADGRRLVTTVANPSRSLWRAPITDHVVNESGLSHFELPTVRAGAPRFAPDYLLYLASRGGADGLWKFKDGSEMELWKGSDGALSEAPAISPDGTRICFSVPRNGRARLYVMASDGTGARPIAETLDAQGAPSWSPDGKWLAVVSKDGKATPLFRVPVDGGAAVKIVDPVDAVVSNPVWSPDGRFIVYSEGKAWAYLRLRGVSPEGRPVSMPEIEVLYLGDRYRFLPDGKALVVMQGDFRHMNFWLLDLASGHRRPLTDMKAGFDMKSFDVSPDGKQIVFDRYRENSDIALIDLPR